LNVRIPYSLALAVASGAVAAAATPLARALAVRIGALDRPGPRRVHREPVPSLGGLAFVAAVLGVAWVARALPGPARELTGGPLVGLTFASIPIIALGVVDDLRGVSAHAKLGVQICAALVLSLFGYGVTAITNPFGGTLFAHALNAPLTVAWVLLVTNAINLIDGLDGLAAGVVAVVSGTLWWVGHVHGDMYVMFLSAILVGATLGFLPFNFPSARVFMGDTGSQFLGLTVAALSLLENRKGTTTLTLLFPIVALGLPLIDSVTAFGRRVLAGRPVFHADSEHIHHRLLRLGWSPHAAVIALWLVSALLGLAAVMLEPLERRTAGWLAMLLALLLLVIFEVVKYFAAKRQAPD
jgi:UDP-GlcNAc:undecaprenyl-phosphate GlcNAc-1-phosphate transferase